MQLNLKEVIYLFLEEKYGLDGNVFEVEEDAEYEGMTITTTIWYSKPPDKFGFRDSLMHMTIDKPLSVILEIE